MEWFILSFLLGGILMALILIARKNKRR